MFTPLPTKRRLFFTPRSTAKRFRPANKTVTTWRRGNRLTARGPRKTGSLTQQVRSLQRVVSSLAPEIKNADVDVTSLNITSAGLVVHCSAVAQGDTSSTRTGNTIMVKNVTLVGRWNRSTDVPFNANAYYQVMLLVDKEQSADAAPAVSDITSNADPVFAMPAITTMERFRILWVSPILSNMQVVTDSDTTANVPTQMPVIRANVTVNTKVSFNGTASTDQEKNAIYMVLLSGDQNNLIDFVGTCRVAFTDV